MHFKGEMVLSNHLISRVYVRRMHVCTLNRKLEFGYNLNMDIKNRDRSNVKMSQLQTHLVSFWSHFIVEDEDAAKLFLSKMLANSSSQKHDIQIAPRLSLAARSVLGELWLKDIGKDFIIISAYGTNHGRLQKDTYTEVSFLIFDTFADAGVNGILTFSGVCERAKKLAEEAAPAPQDILSVFREEFTIKISTERLYVDTYMHENVLVFDESYYRENIDNTPNSAEKILHTLMRNINMSYEQFHTIMIRMTPPPSVWGGGASVFDADAVEDMRHSTEENDSKKDTLLTIPAVTKKKNKRSRSNDEEELEPEQKKTMILKGFKEGSIEIIYED
jgi:hypothetical protein